ncbi:MAG: hypothetical protein IKC24_04640 [Oscillospiraceae bacterium]|nr:hypothetical protein [Oscillospiraceae bacterium]
MENFWDYSVWGFVNLTAAMLISLLAANLLKKSIRLLRVSLIPTSVLGGLLLLTVSLSYQAITGNSFFNSNAFGGNGAATLEIVTYHCLALGFIATTMKPDSAKLTRERQVEIFNTGLTTVATYLLQAVLGFGITIIAAKVIDGFFAAAGVLLPFGFGQGTGQALNYGGIYENDFGFVGGKSFGLTVACMGFLSASLAGVFHLNILRRKGRVVFTEEDVTHAINSEQVQGKDEIPMNGSIDKMTVQIAIVFAAYYVAYLMIRALAFLLPGLKSVLYGFNFLLGVLAATVGKALLNFLRKKKVVNKVYINGFLMNRISGFCFDLMIVAGIGAIRLEFLQSSWHVLLILGIAGMVSTYAYVYFICKRIFPEYLEEQFMGMYGMLTGTASTGIILLRELDPDFKTPVSDNMVYQNFPAMVFGFPIMLLATLAPVAPMMTWLILVAFFAVINLLLFRRQIFGKKR